MGLFNKRDDDVTDSGPDYGPTNTNITIGSSAAPKIELPPLTREAVAAVLDAHGWTYGIDDDGDVGGRWAGHLFYFFLYGEKKEILQVRGRWGRDLPLDQVERVASLLNTWNADKIWPKTYVRAHDETLDVYAESSTDLEHGVTREQLDQLMTCALMTSLRLFAHLDEEFPEAVAEAAAKE